MLRFISTRVLALALVWLALSVPARAQTPVLQQDLQGQANSAFGTATGVDGATAIVGAPNENGGRGAAYVYLRVGTTWTLQQRLEGPDPAAVIGFGGAVAVSGDRVVVGGSAGAGGAFIFVRAGTTWSLEATLQATDGATGGFGSAVDIFGATVVVGAPQVARAPASAVGAAYVYQRSGGVWTAGPVLAPVAGAAGDNFGTSVGVSAGGACVGAPNDDVGANVNQGSVYIFGSAGWTVQQQLVGQPNGGASIGANDQFGTSGVIDGTSVAVAAPGVDYGAVAINIGAAFVFTSNGTTWSLQRAVTGSVSPSGLSVVALSGDLLVLSSPAESSRGAAYLFRRNGTTWTAQAPRLTSNDNLGRGFGSGISTDGVSLFVGAPNAVPSTGAPGSAASVYVVGTAPTGVPGAPSAFTAAASGNVVSMSWGAPTSGGAPTSYTLIARVGGAVVLQLPLGNVTTYAASAPNGTYSLAMRATNASGDGPESAQVNVTVPTAAAAPGAPTGLAGSVAGTTVSFTWAPPSSGGAVTSYLLVAGLTPGFTTPVASLSLPATPGVSVPDVPPGTYYVRVLAQNAGGTSAASNEISVVVAAPTAPGVPTLNAPGLNGRRVTLSWSAGGGAPTSFTLRAFAPGGGLLLTVPGLTGTSVVFDNVPSGSFALDLIAVNAAGASAPSARVTLVVP